MEDQKSPQSSRLPMPIDMTEVYQYEALLGEIVRVNTMNGPLYLQETLRGKDAISNFVSKLTFDYEQARNRTKQACAIAYLEKSEDYIKAKGLKSTDETKKQYVQIDPEYMKAKNEEDMLNALLILMENKMGTMQSAHDDVRAMYKSQADGRGSSLALPQGRDTA